MKVYITIVGDDTVATIHEDLKSAIENSYCNTPPFYPSKILEIDIDPSLAKIYLNINNEEK